MSAIKIFPKNKAGLGVKRVKDLARQTYTNLLSGERNDASPVLDFILQTMRKYPDIGNPRHKTGIPPTNLLLIYLVYLFYTLCVTRGG